MTSVTDGMTVEPEPATFSNRPPTSQAGLASPATTITFVTLGCRLNQADTDQMQTRLQALGWRTVEAHAAPDVVLINTCAVTARAELSDRQAFRRARRANPRARVVVTGCWAQTSPVEIASLGGVDLVLGNADKARLPALLAELAPGRSAPRIEVATLGGARLPLIAPRPHLNLLSPPPSQPLGSSYPAAPRERPR